MNIRIAMQVVMVGIAVTSGAWAGKDLGNLMRENSKGFPVIELKREGVPFAKIHTIAKPNKVIEWEGAYCAGFWFRTPDWFDGPLIWMYARKGPKLMHEEDRWGMIPETKDLSFYLYPKCYSVEGRRCPVFQERFPGYERFTQIKIEANRLKPATNYLVWITFPTPEMTDVKFAMTVESDRGASEYGILPTLWPQLGPDPAWRLEAGATPRDPAKIVADAVKSYKANGIAEALKYLDGQLDAYTDAGGVFHDLYHLVWREAQIGEGRVDLDWGASLNVWLMKRSAGYKADWCVEQLVTNGTWLSAGATS